MHVFWKDRPPSVISHKGGWLPEHGGRPTGQPPKKYWPQLRSVTCDFLNRVKALRNSAGGILPVLGFAGGAIDDYQRWQRASKSGRTYDEQMCEEYGDTGPYIYTSIGALPNPYQGCKGI